MSLNLLPFRPRRAIPLLAALFLSISGSRSFAAAPSITSALTASGNAGTAFSYQITADNSPTGFDAVDLPAGLSVNTSNGVISGIPGAAGTSNVTISATNADGTGTAVLVLTIDPPTPVITSALAVSGQAGAVFSYQITAANSPTSFNATGLPAGLSVNTSNGIISGTPSSAGTSNIVISATNAGGTDTATLVLTIDPPSPVITSALAASGQAGAAFSYQIAATGSPTSFNATGLPAGLVVNTSNGVISGIPGAAGTSSVAISATNAGGTGTAVLVLTIDPPTPVITSALAASGQVGTAFSYQIAATGSPTNFNATGLPAGLSVNTSNGVISGTPSSAGTSNVAISATGAGGTGTAALVLTINPPTPVITSALAAAGKAGTAFSYQITATNSPVSFNAANLPPGLSVNTSNGVISGTPSSAGTRNVAISATNAGGTGAAALVLTINPPTPVITSALAASGKAGAAFSYQITATNSPTSFSAAGLPAGLVVNTSNGVISGTPSSAGTSNVAVSATNAGGTGTAALVLTINPPTPVITSALAAFAQVGTEFSYKIAAVNSPTSFSAAGLPAGFTINTSNGVISGTPSSEGTDNVVISAANAGGTATATLVLRKNPPTPIITSALTASGKVGEAFSYKITAANSPTSFNATGLPAGLSVNTSNGVISGTPSAVGANNATISATNAGGTGTAAFRVFAAAPNLDRVRVYPVPYKPAGGNPNEGKPYSAVDPASGIIFDNLPAVATLTIYTLSGSLAAQFTTSAGTGTLQWDVKNEAGRDVASGGYFAVISSPGFKSVVKRILIIR